MVTGYVRAGVTSETKIQYSSVTEMFSFKSVQDSLLRLVWIVLRPVCVYQKVVSSGTEERETQGQGNIQFRIGNLKFSVSLPGLDHRCSSSNSVGQVDSQACVAESQP